MYSCQNYRITATEYRITATEYRITATEYRITAIEYRITAYAVCMYLEIVRNTCWAYLGLTMSSSFLQVRIGILRKASLA